MARSRDFLLRREYWRWMAAWRKSSRDLRIDGLVEVLVSMAETGAGEASRLHEPSNCASQVEGRDWGLKELLVPPSVLDIPT